MAAIKIIGKLNPKQYSEMLDHLTRKKIKNPFIDAEDIVVNKKPEVETMEAVNAFMRRNPVEKADGGRIGFDLGGLADKLHPKQREWYKNYNLQSGGTSIRPFKKGRAGLGGSGGPVITIDTLMKEKEMMDFLDKKIEAGETKFKSSIQKFAKDNKFDYQMFRRVLKRHYPQTFVYQGMKYKNLPQATIDKIIRLSKEDKNIKQIVTELADELPDVLEVSKKGKPRGAQAQIQRVRSLQKLLKDLGEKPIPVGRSTPLSLDEIARRDKEIIDYFKKNPNAQESADSLAKKIPVTADYIKQSINKRNLVPGIKLIQRDTDIFPEVKALDKIIKENKALITSDKKVTSKINRLVEKLSEATGKSIPELQSAFFARMRRLGSLYSAPETGLKPRVKVYEQIKPPLDYDANFRKHFIQLASRASKGGLNNTQMAILLGLPENEIRLIGDTATMMKGFPKEFKMEGDHTDIKSMMKNFDDYKNNFTRIEFIKGNLNAYKSIFDKKIKDLSVEAGTASPDRQKEILKAQAALRKQFMDETGYRIGEFGIDKGRVVINPKTLRLPDLLNPMNQTLQQAMKNLQTTQVPPDYIVKTGSKPGKKGRILSTPKEVYNEFDNALINAQTVEERLKLFKFANENPEVAKQSVYLKVLSKAPKVGKIAKQIIKGTAVVGGVLGMGALANAAEVKQMPQSSSKQLSKDEEGFTTGEKIAGGAAVGTAAALPFKKGRNILGKAFRTLGTRAASIPLAGLTVAENIKKGENVADAVIDPLVGLELSFPGLFKENVAKITKNPTAQRILNLGRFARLTTPVGLGITAAGLGIDAAKFTRDRIKELQAMSPEQRQELRSQGARQAFDPFQAAGGGIAKLAGDRSGPPPERGPNSQGLQGLMKRVRNL